MTTTDIRTEPVNPGQPITRDEYWAIDIGERDHYEHFDINGNLKVPVYGWLDRAPQREGWEPFFVNTIIGRNPVKIYTYRRIKEG